MKRFIAVLLVSIMLMSMPMAVFADISVKVNGKDYIEDEYDYDYYAAVLKACGMFRDTEKGFDLERSATRTEALVMFLRIIGAEDAAIAANYDTSFSDVPKWAKAYVGYAEKNGLSSGIGGGKFGSNNTVSAKDFATFILRGLGYSDKDGDFTWADSVEYLEEIGVINESYEQHLADNSFIRGDMALISHEALLTKVKSSNELLVEKLGVGTEITTEYDVFFYERIKEEGCNFTFVDTGNVDIDDYFPTNNGIVDENLLHAFNYTFGIGTQCTSTDHLRTKEYEGMKVGYEWFKNKKESLPYIGFGFMDEKNMEDGLRYYTFIKKPAFEVDMTVSQKTILIDVKAHDLDNIVNISSYLNYENDKLTINWAQMPKDVVGDMSYATISPSQVYSDNYVNEALDWERTQICEVVKLTYWYEPNMFHRITGMQQSSFDCNLDSYNKYCGALSVVIYDEDGFVTAVGWIEREVPDFE